MKVYDAFLYHSDELLDSIAHVSFGRYEYIEKGVYEVHDTMMRTYDINK